jgi:hypothetical protein
VSGLASGPESVVLHSVGGSNVAPIERVEFLFGLILATMREVLLLFGSLITAERTRGSRIFAGGTIIGVTGDK